MKFSNSIYCLATISLILNKAILATAASNLTTTCVYVINQNNTGQLDKLCFEPQAAQIKSVTTYNSSYIYSSFNSTLSSLARIEDLNFVWLLLTAFLVFAMQIGFTMLEAGNLIEKTQDIFFKNIMNIAIASIGWYLFGYDVAYGTNGNGFIGTGEDYLALAHHVNWNSHFFEFVYCATCVTVVAGAVLERCSFLGYFVYSFLLSTWVYPIIAHWIWSPQGWLSAYNPKSRVRGGAIDFAGSGVVFMVAGWTGLCAMILLGPRPDVFDARDQKNINGNQNNANVVNVANVPNSANINVNENNLRRPRIIRQDITLQVLGLLLIWFGWYGFNPGRTWAANGKMQIASKVAVTTTIAAVSGGIMAAILAAISGGTMATILSRNNLTQTINGVLAGLVSISASCATVNIGDSIAIAVIGVIVYYGASAFLRRLRIDDPLEVFPIFGCGGMWGLIAAAWFSSSKNISAAGYNSFLVNASRGRIFAAQILAIIVIIIWSFFWAFIVFFVMKSKDLLHSRRRGQQHDANNNDVYPDNNVNAIQMQKQPNVLKTENNDALTQNVQPINRTDEHQLLVNQNEIGNVVPDEETR